MKKLLLVIDVQKSFVNEYTNKFVKRIEDIINSNSFDDVVFTKFINSIDSSWYKELKYEGCLTAEQQRIVLDTKKYKVFNKYVYTALNNELEEYIKTNGIQLIYLCGFDTDACVSKTALDLFEKGYEVYVLKDYCMSDAGIEIHNNAINSLKRLIGNSRVI